MADKKLHVPVMEMLAKLKHNNKDIIHYVNYVR